MTNHLNELLEQTNEPLSFIVIVPSWPDRPGWSLLDQCKWTKHKLSMAAKVHGFTSGAQHLSKDRFRMATHKTSIFFLRNKQGENKWPTSKKILKELQYAFRSLHRSSHIGLKLTGITLDLINQSNRKEIIRKYFERYGKIKKVFFPKSRSDEVKQLCIEVCSSERC